MTDDPPVHEVLAEIRRHREAEKISLRSLASAVGSVSAPAIQSYETGQRACLVRNAAVVLAYFNRCLVFIDELGRTHRLDPSRTNAELGALIRVSRERQDWAAYQVSHRAGFSAPSMMSHYELGFRQMYLPNIDRVLSVLKCRLTTMQRCKVCIGLGEQDCPERCDKDDTTTYVNLTPHPIFIRDEDDTLTGFPSSGTVARVVETVTPAAGVDGHRSVTVSVSHVDGLPDPVPGTVYIVSMATAMGLLATGGERRDVVYPHRQTRDENGQVMFADEFANLVPSSGSTSEG